jgi:hypothetical protein
MEQAEVNEKMKEEKRSRTQSRSWEQSDGADEAVSLASSHSPTINEER